MEKKCGPHIASEGRAENAGYFFGTAVLLRWAEALPCGMTRSIGSTCGACVANAAELVGVVCASIEPRAVTLGSAEMKRAVELSTR